MRHLPRGSAGSNDLGLAHKLVAEKVVAVAVGVDHGRDRRPGNERVHRFEHRSGRGDVPQRLDEKRCAFAHYQTCIGLAPGTVRHQPGVGAFAKLVEALLVVGRLAIARFKAAVTPG